MKKAKFYTSYLVPGELLAKKRYPEDQTRKLFSKMKGKEDSPDSLHFKLFFESNKNGYPAYMKAPEQEITFYDFKTLSDVKVLDDVMASIEINNTFGYFVSERFKVLLGNFKLPEHRFYPVQIEFKEQKHAYHFLLVTNQNNCVNYEQSLFVERFNKSKELSISNHDELVEPGGNNPLYFRAKNITEKNIVFNCEIDMYNVLTRSTSPIFFSDRLVNAFVNHGFTGLKFNLVERPEFYVLRKSYNPTV